MNDILKDKYIKVDIKYVDFIVHLLYSNGYYWVTNGQEKLPEKDMINTINCTIKGYNYKMYIESYKTTSFSLISSKPTPKTPINIKSLLREYKLKRIFK